MYNLTFSSFYTVAVMFKQMHTVLMLLLLCVWRNRHFVLLLRIFFATDFDSFFCLFF